MPRGRDVRAHQNHPEPFVDPRLTLAVEHLLRREPTLGIEVPRSPGRAPSTRPDLPERPVRPGSDRPRRPRPDADTSVDTDIEVDLGAKHLTALFRDAGPASVVWSGTAGELEVLLAETRVAVRPGVVLVALTASTDQTGQHELVVPLLVGTEERHLGLSLGAQKRAVGHSPLAALWSDALTAHSWSTLLTIAETAIATATSKLGRDVKAIQGKPGAMFTREGVLVVRSRSGVTAAEVFTVRPR